RSAHVRYLLWLVVLAKCLVPPFYAVPLAILPQQEQAEPMAMAPPTYLLPPEREAIGAMMAEPAELPSTAFEAPAPPTVEHGWHSISVHEWLGIGWMVGACVFLTFNLLRALRANLWLWRRRKVLPAELRKNIEELFSTQGIRSFPDAWLVEGFNQPFVWGLVRGSIYLPMDFLNINRPEHQRSVLGHELSHVLRFDAAVNILQVIAQAIFWFHPLVWWTNKKIRAEREKCCDEMAIAQLNTLPRDYSTAILETLAPKHKPIRSVPSLAVAGPVNNIEERIRTMLRPGKKFYKRPNVVVASTILLVALLTVPTALVLTAHAGNPTQVYPLHLAASAGDIEQAGLLISKGTDINVKDDTGRTPLHLSSRYCHTNVSKLLVSKGADVNAKDQVRQTPLHEAGSSDVAELLITKGAKIDVKDEWDCTPLMCAAIRGVKGVAQLLVDKGADVEFKDKWGETPLHEAADNGHKEIADLLIAAGANIEASGWEDRTPIHDAAISGHKDVIELLIAKGADIKTKDEEGRTPLLRAAEGGHYEVTRILIANGADINTRANEGSMPIHVAAARGSNEVAELLISKGAEINAKNNEGSTPLHLTVARDHADTAEFLIKRG
ncbi:MAG: ankyrin repeat domain-containing protein, partial [Phycisphaerales bacterium]